MRISNDTWNTNMKISDKFMHLIFFFFAMALTYLLYYIAIPKIVISLLIAGVIKECYDAKVNDGFSVKDLICDVIGIGLGVCLVTGCLFDIIVWSTLCVFYLLLNQQNMKLPFVIK